MTVGISRPTPRDVGFVLQGHVGEAERQQVQHTIAVLRRLSPESQIVVSTWKSCASLVGGLDTDALVLSNDPGALHSIRVSGETQNNVNRQIASTMAGLDRCERPYAVKMRMDSSLDSLDFLELYAAYQRPDEPERIVVPTLFTIDPMMFEQVPMHVSDWFQFGSIQALRNYWRCPFMTPQEAVWYGAHPYARHSTHLDRRFYCLFAVEQHLALNYALGLGLTVPEFHNDTAAPVMAAHRTLLARHFIVARLEQIGLDFPKYAWATKSDFQKLNCVDFLDWLSLAAEEAGLVLTEEQLTLISARQKRKALARRLYRLAKPLWPVMANPAIKNSVNALLRGIVPRSR